MRRSPRSFCRDGGRSNLRSSSVEIGGALAAALLTFGFLMSAGCSMPGRGEPYSTQMHRAGPLEVTLENVDKDHVVVITTPTGGWRVSLDEARRASTGGVTGGAAGGAPGIAEAFITARRPSGMATQVLTPHRVTTDLPADTPLDVHVRVIDPGAPDRGPYETVTFRAE